MEGDRISPEYIRLLIHCLFDSLISELATGRERKKNKSSLISKPEDLYQRLHALEFRIAGNDCCLCFLCESDNEGIGVGDRKTGFDMGCGQDAVQGDFNYLQRQGQNIVQNLLRGFPAQLAFNRVRLFLRGL